MDLVEELFNFEDLSGTFSIADVAISMLLSFVLTALIGWIYQKTHKGTSYTQSYVQTLILMGLVVNIIMLVVGSNIARAFSLVGALSIIRFRNAIKETRDVGFVFFAMAIGMATGTKFYLLAIIATVVIGLIIYVMHKFEWFSRPVLSQILKVQVDKNSDVKNMFDDVLARYTASSNLICIDSVRSGEYTELTYNIVVKRGDEKTKEFIDELKKLNGNQRVSLLTGYNSTEL